MKDRAINRKYNGYQRRLVSMVYKFFWQKKVSEASVNEGLGQQLHKKLIKKFKIRKVHARFKDNVWVADLAELRSLSSFGCGVEYLSFVIDVFT